MPRETGPVEEAGHERGVVADAELEEWLAQVRAASSAPGVVPDLVVLRAARKCPPGPSLACVQDLVVPGAPGAPEVGVRLYRPSAGRLPLVVHVHVHGGGFTSGGLDSHDRACRRLAQRTDAVVLAVGYRLAPEHSAPAAIDDVVHVVRWTQSAPEELGPFLGQPAMVADSAGGAIAALATARLAGAGVVLSALLLVCPNADMTLSQPSVEDKGRGRGLEKTVLRWFVAQWLPRTEPDDPAWASPLRADLSALPTTCPTPGWCTASGPWMRSLLPPARPATR